MSLKGLTSFEVEERIRQGKINKSMDETDRPVWEITVPMPCLLSYLSGFMLWNMEKVTAKKGQYKGRLLKDL